MAGGSSCPRQRSQGQSICLHRQSLQQVWKCEHPPGDRLICLCVLVRSVFAYAVLSGFCLTHQLYFRRVICTWWLLQKLCFTCSSGCRSQELVALYCRGPQDSCSLSSHTDKAL